MQLHHVHHLLDHVHRNIHVLHRWEREECGGGDVVLHAEQQSGPAAHQQLLQECSAQVVAEAAQSTRPNRCHAASEIRPRAPPPQHPVQFLCPPELCRWKRLLEVVLLQREEALQVGWTADHMESSDEHCLRLDLGAISGEPLLAVPAQLDVSLQPTEGEHRPHDQDASLRALHCGLPRQLPR